MRNIAKEILDAMSPKQRKKFLRLQSIVILMAIFEIFGIASIGPFMALVGNINLAESNKLIHQIYIVSGAASANEFLYISGLFFLVVLALSALISITAIWLLSIFAAETGAEMADSLFDYYLKKEYIEHTKISSTYLIKQIATEVNRVTDNILQPFVQINARVVVSVFISLAIVFYEPIISLAGIAIFISAYLAMYFLVKRRLYNNGSIISKVSQQRFKLLKEGFGAIKIVKITDSLNFFIEKFNESGRIFAKAYGSSNGLYNMPRYVMELLIYSGMVGLILILLRFNNGSLSEVLPAISIFGIAAFKLLPSFQQIYSGMAQIKSNWAALEFIKKDLISSYNLKMADEECHEIDIVQNSCIELKDIFYKYPDKIENVLNGLSLSIPMNSNIGFVGESGSGKTTIIDILLGILKPDAGEVSIFGNVLYSKNLKSWQKLIGYVPQNLFLIDGTIKENIAFGLKDHEISISQIYKSIKSAHLDAWVGGLPKGIDTTIGEGGIELSGGQRQRLGIARAMYGNPMVLIFDEATSALDGITEQNVMSAIDELAGKRTIILIAHRLNTLKSCDTIFMIDKGKLSAQGSFDKLISENEKFRQYALESDQIKPGNGIGES